MTLTPAGPHSSASTFSMSTPAFAAQTCAWVMVGNTACGAEMWMTDAPGLARNRYPPRSTLNISSKLMSTMDSNPLGDKRSAAAEKLPAAPEMSGSDGSELFVCCRQGRFGGWVARTSALVPIASPEGTQLVYRRVDLSRERLITATRAPARAKSSAIPRLIPLVLPATKTLLPDPVDVWDVITMLPRSGVRAPYAATSFRWRPWQFIDEPNLAGIRGGDPFLDETGSSVRSLGAALSYDCSGLGQPPVALHHVVSRIWICRLGLATSRLFGEVETEVGHVDPFEGTSLVV